MSRALPLKSLAWIWGGTAFALGLFSAWLWLQSAQAWQNHLARSELAGVLLYDTLRHQAPAPEGIRILPLKSQDDKGTRIEQPDLTGAGYITNVPILAQAHPGGAGPELRLIIASPNLRYAVSDLSANGNRGPAAKLGRVTRLLASYCSAPRVFARFGGGPWQEIDGAQIWSCDAAPRDLRLPAVLLALAGLAMLLSHGVETAARFARFARLLHQHPRLDAPESYSSQGPGELQEIVSAVNAHLERARSQLEKRAAVLSGVSHDLGTPATRLRLRAALIGDEELRGKLEGDIDNMTGMIESVLTYTRSELSVETPRQLSLRALVEAVVADYQDLGRSVDLSEDAPIAVQGGASLFSARAGLGNLPETRRILVTARPILLERALCNLIDNALKYGRRAHVSLEASSEYAAILVEDEGSELGVADMEEVLAPFRRGTNTQSIDGFGLGLTIVATVAEQHGGGLSYEMGRRGLRARLEILRH